MTPKPPVDSEDHRAALEDQRRLLRAVFEHAPGFMMLLEGEAHVVTLANENAQAFTGRVDLVGRPLADALSGPLGQRLCAMAERARSTGRSARGDGLEVELRRDDGVARAWVDVAFQPVVVPDGAVCAVVALGRDVTDHRRLEDERATLLTRERAARADAERVSALKDRLLANISHELRTPLTAALGWFELLRSGRVEPARRARALEVIERSTRSLARLIDDLIDVNRTFGGRLSLELAPVDLAAVAADAFEALAPSFEGAGVHLELDLAPVAPVLGDGNRLRQVTINLATNALRFTPRGGAVRARVCAEGGAVTLRVSDTGRGIDPAFLPRAFEAFQQEDGEITRRHGGLGVGLAIVRSVVEQHGGAVAAESDGVDRGATFTVRIPRWIDAPPRPAPPRPDAPGDPHELEGRAILVVDDDRDTREMLAFLLAHHGARVTLASSALEALEALSHARFDLLLSDIGMPQEDGYSLATRLRAAEGDARGALPAVALTAYSQEEDRARALDAGFTAHMAKPVDPLRLVGLLARLCSAARPSREP
jgi:PAS domain S-box-containing protein